MRTYLVSRIISVAALNAPCVLLLLTAGCIFKPPPPPPSAGVLAADGTETTAAAATATILTPADFSADATGDNLPPDRAPADSAPIRAGSDSGGPIDGGVSQSASSTVHDASDGSTSIAAPNPANTETWDPSYEIDRPPTGMRTTVGGLLGQVNGRPIYIDAVLKPITDRLASLGREGSRRSFVEEANVVIRRRLRTVIENELLLSIARADLTEQEQRGLSAWVESLYEEFRRREGGSQAEANRRSLDKYGIGIAERVEEFKRRELVRLKLSNQISKKVVVTFREIERYYRDHPEEFNPAPSITLRLIMVPADDQQRESAVTTALEEGQPFADVSRNHSVVLSGKGGALGTLPLTDGIENSEITAWPEVDAVVRGLNAGEYAGPVNIETSNGTSLIWVYVESIEAGRGRTLYDAQHDIENKLNETKFSVELNKYFAQLRSRASIDDEDLMAFKLLEIALERWAPAR